MKVMPTDRGPRRTDINSPSHDDGRTAGHGTVRTAPCINVVVDISVRVVLANDHRAVLRQCHRLFAIVPAGQFRTGWNHGLRQILQTGITLPGPPMTVAGTVRRPANTRPIDRRLAGGGSKAVPIGGATYRTVNRHQQQEQHVQHDDANDGQRDDTGGHICAVCCVRPFCDYFLVCAWPDNPPHAQDATLAARRSLF
uniref:Uncharacterized protein n=1 Tax=Anopheles melas TaxID=34690 RepID=A0A182TTA3_9DIPT